MGVKGLQSFMERCCPDACVTVNLREMARQHAAKTQQDPTLVVDGMASLCHWYSCEDWVCGGQWKEYMEILKNWVDAFTTAGIKLVFFFDGVVEQQKRQEWVKRRRRANGDVSKIFRHIKEHGVKPHKELFCLPSALATFTPFALRFLGQQVFCSVREADFEIASYARQHGSMGILGQDSDFIIYDSVPYFSVGKLRINSLTTVMYDRERLCRSIGLPFTLLPLLACLLGNDVVSEQQMQGIRNNAMATYRKNCSPSRSCAPHGQMVVAVAQLLRSLSTRETEDPGSVLQSLNLSASQRDLLQQGICSYLLPGQNDLELFDGSEIPSAFEKHINPQILKACRQKHVAAEGFMVYNVVCAGVTECSNTLEDEEDKELLPQAIVYKPCRQRIYGLLLLGQDANTLDVPVVKEWFVYPGNPLTEPDMVHPVPVNLPCGQPCLDQLWFGNGPEVSALRLESFFFMFDCSEYTELYGAIENSLLAALCLVTYIVQQVESLSEEDVDAYLSQAVCLKLYSPQQLQNIELPALSSRAVQLGSLYVRGLSHLLAANTASGGPLPSDALMPWHSFDGRLFHSKYLLAHSGKENSELLDNNMSCITLFLQIKEKLRETCKKRGRILQSRPRTMQKHWKTTMTGFSSSAGESWRGRGVTAGGHRGQWSWRERGEDRRDRSGSERPCDRAGNQHFHTFYPNYRDERHQNMSWQPRQSRGPSHHPRRRYHLAPRWPQPPAP
ncbi:Constitutive coactivator of peroxisome proliferator-activated receptor gamma [Oryzias melastigma]|uniref:Constitutive coactivator of peroxisome proliferator-activated receptor gamma n=1 Tax=Oryzias melastigma TaxID=30732 RepID=A0A834CKL6_ORYME|nr:Constitutive coactivator of peroxisome proliferator-activated receptor gamma [Oryzias melastigma]